VRLQPGCKLVDKQQRAVDDDRGTPTQANYCQRATWHLLVVENESMCAGKYEAKTGIEFLES